MSAPRAGPFGDLFEKSHNYPVMKSNLLFGRQIGVQRIAWIDNDKAILPGIALVREATTGGQEKLSSGALGIYVWDARTNHLERYADLPLGRGVFYDHGNIAYRISRTHPAESLYTFNGENGRRKFGRAPSWGWPPSRTRSEHGTRQAISRPRRREFP